MAQGKYVVIEGHDGTGKTTQAELLVERLRAQGIIVSTTKEPGGNAIGEAIREVLLNGSLKREPGTNLLLYTANRYDLWHTFIKPRLDKGEWVIATRNYWSSLTLQGYGEGLDLDFIESTTKQFLPPHYMSPDVGIVLDIDSINESRARIAKRGELKNPDTFESRGDDFQQKVIQGYRSIVKAKKLPCISASQSVQVINDQIWDVITSHDTALI